MRIKPRVIGLFFCTLSTVLGQGITKTYVSLDPANGTPQNLSITIYTDASVHLASAADITGTFQGIAANSATTQLPLLSAQPIENNPTGVFFLIPLTQLAPFQQLSYQFTLKAGSPSPQTTPESRISLAPLQAIQQLNQQISQQATDLQTARQQTAQALAAYNGGLPETPDFVGMRLQGLTLLVQFSTSQAGLLHARLLDRDNQMEVDTDTEKKVGLVHTFSFSKTSLGRHYYVEATVWDPKTQQDVQGRKLSGISEARLQYDMPAQIPNKPHIATLNLTPGPRSIQVAFTVDSPAAIQVSCYHLTDPAVPKSDGPPVSSPTKFSAPDKFGLLSGPKIAGPAQYACTSLDPEQTYLVEVEARDDYDQALDSTSQAEKTSKTTVPLSFSGPMAVTATAAGLQVGWKASVSDATGKITIQLPGGQPASVDAKVSGTDFSAAVDPTELAKAFPVDATTNVAKPSQQAPVITASMTKGSESVQLSFSVSVNVPSTAAKAKSSTAGAPDPVVKGQTNVANGVDKNSKFSWSDLLTTGIGALIKLI